MKVAVTYRLPIGPIQASLAIAAKAKGFDVLEMPKGKEGICPGGKSWDDYDTLVYFMNGAPTFKTSAKVLWWMCDLRDPKPITSGTTASEMFVCNQLFKDAYAEHFGVPAYYLPQCGNDAPITDGRKFTENILFLGMARFFGRNFAAANPSDSDELKALIGAREFHGNRSPIIEEIRKEHPVKIINREGLTKDQKYLYSMSPVSLSISLPVQGYTSNRLYNILSSNGFALVNWFPGIENLFENKKHLVWFKTPQEARELSSYYLARPEEAARIRNWGTKLYRSRDTAAHRLDYMLGDEK